MENVDGSKMWKVERKIRKKPKNKRMRSRIMEKRQHYIEKRGKEH